MSIIINGMKITEGTTFEYISNPKRAGSRAHARYDLYQEATNLAEYEEICKEGDFYNYSKADLRYDTEKGHLTLINEDGEKLIPALSTKKQTETEPTANDDVDETNDDSETTGDDADF